MSGNLHRGRFWRNRHIGTCPVQRNRTIAGLQNDLGPASASILSFQVRIAGLGRSFLQGIRGEFRIYIAGMAIRKNLEEPGRVRVMPEAALEMSMSSFGGAEKRSSTLPSRLSIFTLPPAFSTET